MGHRQLIFYGFMKIILKLNRLEEAIATFYRLYYE